MTLKDLGNDIREQRERVGLTIDDVAARIKVSARTLQAIENGSVETLPHAVYTKGFVRSFATVVGFSQEDLNARLEDVFPANPLENPKPDMGPLVRSGPTPGIFKKTVLLLVIVGLLSGIGIGVWYLATTYGGSLLELVKQPFSAITTPAPHEQYAENAVHTAEQVSPAVAGFLPLPQSTSTSSVTTAPVSAVSSQGTSLIGEAHAAESVAYARVLPATAPEAEASAALPASSGAATPEGRQFVFVKANQECWIGSRTDTARSREYVTLRPGQVWIFPFADSLELNLGNAGGVVVQHNGKDMGSLGKEKEVKTVRF